MHERTATCSCQVEHRERVNDETQLLVRQQRIDEDEADGGEQQQPYSPVEEAERHEEQRAAQGSRYGGIKVPQKGRGLMERGVKDNLGVDREGILGEIIRICIFFLKTKKHMYLFFIIIIIKKDIPQLELLLRIVLYHNTCPSGHKSFPQKKVSTAIVRAAAKETKAHVSESILSKY